MEQRDFAPTLTLRSGYEFSVDFGQPPVADLRLDEPAPLGQGHGPNAARLLAAAVGNCLSASLLLCLRKARIDVPELRTTVTGSIMRNERGRLRIGEIRQRHEGCRRAPAPTPGVGSPSKCPSAGSVTPLAGS